MLVIIDNYDSFTYNLVHYFESAGQKTIVFKNNAVTIDDIQLLSPKYIVISPGPGKPANAGISKQVVQAFAGKVPLLGVCLGHQCIAEVYGAKIVRASVPVHGKVFPISHTNKGVFKSLPASFNVTRYHSLIVDSQSLPDTLMVTAKVLKSENKFHDNIEIMALQHTTHAIFGVQFHPEAILSEQGMPLLQNFLLCHEPYGNLF